MSEANEDLTRSLEDERAQIGHEIHDALLPLIFAAQAGVERLIGDSGENGSAAREPSSASDSSGRGGPLSPAERAKRLRDIESWLDRAMRIGRDLLVATYPPELDQQAWFEAARQTAETLHPNAAIQWQIDPAAQSLRRDVAAAAYRITVEAIRNAMRHGQADRAHVTARLTADQWAVEITDHGRGFDPQQVAADRFGIKSMKSRAVAAGGRLTIDSRPGGPTTVRLVFPRSAADRL